MKNICKILAFMLLISSCDILDRYPHNAVSSDSVTEEDLSLLYTGLYRFAQYKPSFEGYFQNDLAGGDFYRGGGSRVVSAANWIKECILPTNGYVNGPYTGYYAWLYQVNKFIAMAESCTQNDNVREMTSVAHFFRALIYYNLTSKYRIAPIIRVATNEQVTNDTEEDCWAFVNEELDKALEYAPKFTTKNYVSIQTVKALMARAYLAQGRKKEAADLAEELISDPLFSLDHFDNIFRGGSDKEEIFTFLNLKEEGGITFAGNFLRGFVPTPETVALFTSDDERTYYSAVPFEDEISVYKYINESTSDPIIMFRISEMYLISAEGRGVSGGGIDRLNELRTFRGLGPVSPKNEEEMLDAVLAERQLEFIGEGFRWFDLVRTGKYCETTGLAEKYTVFPIPQRELDLNPNLHQNPLWQ